MIRQAGFLAACLGATISCVSVQAPVKRPVFVESKRVSIGASRARAIWRQASSDFTKASPAILLIPGAGVAGPEELIGRFRTSDGSRTLLFDDIADQFSEMGFSTLQVGKPGVDYAGDSDSTPPFYDAQAYENLRWKDWLETAREALAFLRDQGGVDPRRIYLLGHSEGTQLAVDLAADSPTVAGVILLGYAGEDMATVMDWQYYGSFRAYLRRDVDLDHDDYVSREEAATAPEFKWDWVAGQTQVSLDDLMKARRADPALQAGFKLRKDSKFLSGGIWARGPLYSKTAAIPGSVDVLTGELDVQTPPQQARLLEEQCRLHGKEDCRIRILPGLGHGFSPPRPPRADPYLDDTVGPLAPSFRSVLKELAKDLRDRGA